jgi:hypothetical protein
MLNKVSRLLITGTFVLGMLALVHQDGLAKNVTAGETKASVRIRGLKHEKEQQSGTEDSSSPFRGIKAAAIDTLLYFTAEGPSWNDEITGIPWDTVDHTVEKGHGTPLLENRESNPPLTTSDMFSASGNWWWLYAWGHSGIYSAMNSDPFTGWYARNMENALVSPKIAHEDLDSNLADLWLMYYLAGQVVDPDTLIDNSDYVSNEYKLDDGEWRGISTLHGPEWYVFNDYEKYSWLGMDEWPDEMRDLTPVLDSTWDTLQVAVRFHSDDDDTTGSFGLSVDDITLTGRITEVLTILDVYAGLPGIAGDTITVEGFFHSPDYPRLGLNQEMFERKIVPSPHSYLLLTGSAPDSSLSYSYLEVEGIIDTVARSYPSLGVSYEGQLTVTSSRFIKAGHSPSWKKRDRRKSLEQGWDEKACLECTFAILISSGDEPFFKKDMDDFKSYVGSEGLGLADSNTSTFETGSGENRATHDNIQAAFNELKNKIAACEAAGKDAKLIKLVTNHGSGYHSGSQDTVNGPQKWEDGYAGGHIDTNGDETDAVSEAELKWDLTEGPAKGHCFRYDLDGDGTYDFQVCNYGDSLVAYSRADTTSPWVRAGSDTNGDSLIDGNDGGIDLNGDGDKTDSFAWDEDLYMTEDGSCITDDEWAKWQRELSDACLDSLFELIDCCFSGGFKKDEQDSMLCKTAVQKRWPVRRANILTRTARKVAGLHNSSSIV